LGSGKIRSKDLDFFVAECDRLGGIHSPECAEYLRDFSHEASIQIDESLDPFSSEYTAQQISLYEEISGRKLDQKIGELTQFNIEERVTSANPYAYDNITFIAKHSRCVLSSILAANLKPGATVLDMGSGWGLSSEMMAFCGAKVTAVDINPDFVSLVKQRAQRIGLPIYPKLATFDDFETDERFDMVFFYECLHHAVKPWEVLNRVSKFLTPGGKVVFAGEPINEYWKHWGIRKDSLSIYCIRKFGWFESGWSLSFLISAFEHAGLRLSIADGAGLDGGVIGVAVKKEEQDSHDFSFVPKAQLLVAQIEQKVSTWRQVAASLLRKK
jgi:2-polyprenyl-3-methyl-5-hydroxy-6-metoxy-1,4-benzoquinol methylase